MVFLFRSEFFFRTRRELEYLFFLSHFFQNSKLGYMTKTLNQIIFFSSTKIRIFFSATLGIKILFRKKNIPHTPFKLNGRPLLVLTAACWQGIIEIIIVSVSVWYRKWTQVMSITYPGSVHARLFSRAPMLRPSWMLLQFCNVQHCQIGCSIFFPYLWSFRWPNYIVTLPRYFSSLHLNINTGPP